VKQRVRNVSRLDVLELVGWWVLGAFRGPVVFQYVTMFISINVPSPPSNTVVKSAVYSQSQLYQSSALQRDLVS
jgi:hypothetical protein